MEKLVKKIAALCLAYLVRLVIKLRYKILCKDFHLLLEKTRKENKGILFLPSHPAEIDPVILTTLLWPYFYLRPVVLESFFFQKEMSPIMKFVKAIPIPNFGESANSWKIKRGEYAIKEVQEGVQKGENFLIYPTGRLKREGKDSIGGASFVSKIIQETPEVKIVLVRIIGLWGSSFSRALTGHSPDFLQTFLQGLKIIIKNGIFFVPKRKIEIEFLVFPNDFPRSGSKIEINNYIENWLNYYLDEKGNPLEREPLYLVSFSRWKKELPKVQCLSVSKPKREELIIPKEKREAVYQKISELSGNAISDIQENMDLSTDLGLDSLDIATLYAFLDQSYDIDYIKLGDLRTVHDVLEAAAGEKQLHEEEIEKRVAKEWPQEKNRPDILLPEGKTLQEVFLGSTSRLSQYMACADFRVHSLTYRKLKRAALVLAMHFASFPGKYIGVLLPSSVSVYIVVFALLLAKKIPVMLNWTAGVRSLHFADLLLDLETIISARQFLNRVQTIELGNLDEKLLLLEDIRSSLTWKEKIKGFYFSLLGKEALMSRLKLHTIKEDDPTLLLFTSGTETLPKAVPLTHKNLLSNQRAALSCVLLLPQDVLYGVLPPFHSFGFSLTGILPLLCGVRVFYSPDPNDSYTIAQEVETCGITLLCMAPSFYKNLFKIATRRQLKRVRWFISGAEKATKDLFDYVKTLGKNKVLLEGYGITECSPIITICRPEKLEVGVGKPLPNIELCMIHPETKKLLPKGDMGEICIHGPSVFQGYLGKAITNPFIVIGEKIWYRSGDMGFINKEGCLILGGRLKRFIKVGGEMVSLTAVEEELIQLARKNHWAPSNDKPILALVGFEKYEEKSHLVLFTVFPLAKEDVNVMLRDSGFGRIVRIADVKQIEFIPLTGTGKIHYRLLEEKLLEGTK